MTRTALTLTAILALTAPATAQTAPKCAVTIEAADTKLRYKFGEDVRFVGRVTSPVPQIMQLYVNAASGTWTVMLINKDGCARTVAEGVLGRDFIVMPGRPT